MRKILWLNPPDHPLGENITKVLSRYVEKLGWELVSDPTDDHELIFFGSDSTLTPELLDTDKTKILWFWGWMPRRFLDLSYRNIYSQKLQLIRKCDYVFVPSPGTQDFLYYCGIKSNIMFPGIDNELIDTVHIWKSAGSVRKMKNRQDKLNQIIYIGRLVLHKDVAIIIYALHLLKSIPRTTDIPKLCILGQGTEKERIMKFAAELGVKIEIIETDDRNKIRILKQSIALVSASTYEGFGAPAAEAAYSGIPIILRDSPHNRFFWQDNAQYFWTPEGLANAIYRIVENPELEWNELSMNGRRRAKDVFTMTKWAKRIDDLFKNCVEENIKNKLGKKIRDNPSRTEYMEIYDEEHERNIEFRLYRLDPTWKRHWRVQDLLNVIKTHVSKILAKELGEYFEPAKELKDHYKKFKILDAGCAEGVFTSWFTGEGFETWGIDCSNVAIEKAKKIIKEFGDISLAHLSVCFADDIGVADEFFDVVWCGEMLEHLPENILDKSMNEMLRVLKKDGLFIATTPIGKHHEDTLHLRNWNDESIKKFFELYENQLSEVKITKIAEGGGEPSCYFIVGKRSISSAIETAV